MSLSVVQGFSKSLAMTVLSEIGDKTFFAAAILAMRHPRRYVLAGCLSALIVMTILSAAVGWAAPNLISRTLTKHIATILFLGFGVWSLRDAFHEGESEELAEVEAELDADLQANGKTKSNGKADDDDKKKKRPLFSQFFSPIFLKAFSITFFGEWGDKSQIATIGLAAAENPLGVVLGGILFLKNKIRNWRRDMQLKENDNKEKVKSSLCDLEKAAESSTLSDEEQRSYSNLKHELMEIEKLVILDMKQKARIRWTVDGDENSKFFHGHISCKNRKGRINGLLINGRWVTDVTEIKDETHRFFGDKFKESRPVRPLLISPHFRSLSMMDAIRLEAPISVKEIKDAVWACGSDRAPGPDGFTFKFLKSFWDTVSGDIVNFVHHFEKNGTIANGCNSSFITLVPKCKDPMSLGDFRPISLIGCMYKIVAKILACRIKKVIGTVVDEVQSAYVEGRNILDGPLIVNEICSWAKKCKKKVLLFKVDFDKAFDSINWGYLDSVLQQMGFGNVWRKWIRGCLESSRASVIINGSPTSEFNVTRGVRQGDPLSPFLFIIAMEGLNVALKAAKEKCIFKGVNIPNCDYSLSHLFYADDALFLGEWSKSNIKNLARILRCFHISSGLNVNFSKSKVFGIGASIEETTEWAEILGCSSGTLPFQYLGVPVGANMNLVKNWQPVVDRFQAKLSAWKSKTLSFGGRVTLIKAVLGNLPNYFLSLFKAPIGVIEKLEGIRRRFLWGGDENRRKIHWVAWDKVAAPKSKGGLGVGSIRSFNIGSMVKWWWRLNFQPNALWSRVINSIHKLQNKPPDYLANNSNPGVWRNIANSRGDLAKHNLNFHSIFDFVDSNNQVAPRRIRSKINGDGRFTMEALRSLLEDSPVAAPPAGHSIMWRKEVPIKVLCFVWRAVMGRIASKVAIQRRGISVSTPNCSYCGADTEDENHILVTCPFAVKVWRWIWSWCGLQNQNHMSIRDILLSIGEYGVSKKKKILLGLIVYGTLWCLWKARNNRTYNENLSSASRVTDDILSLTFLWFKHRSNLGICDWSTWCVSPFNCM